jgi:hypothetical protein
MSTVTFSEAEGIIKSKFPVSKNYRMGQNFHHIYPLMESMHMVQNKSLGGEVLDCANPFDWVVFENEDYAVLMYRQQYAEGFNSFTIYGKLRKDVMALVDTMEMDYIIRRPRR